MTVVEEPASGQSVATLFTDCWRKWLKRGVVLLAQKNRAPQNRGDGPPLGNQRRIRAEMPPHCYRHAAGRAEIVHAVPVIDGSGCQNCWRIAITPQYCGNKIQRARPQ